MKSLLYELGQGFHCFLDGDISVHSIVFTHAVSATHANTVKEPYL
jgi:hypothetical protein